MYSGLHPQNLQMKKALHYAMPGKRIVNAAMALKIGPLQQVQLASIRRIRIDVDQAAHRHSD